MKKDIIIALLIIMLAAIFIMNTDFSSVEDYYLEHAEDITEDSMSVSLSIRCDSILENTDKLDKELFAFIPPDGILLSETEYVLRDGDTVFDILLRAVKKNRLQMEYKGSESNIYGTVYVESIGYIYEFSCGPLSGWTYTVNGESPRVGCSNYTLSDGDIIEWIYTCDYTESDRGEER
ncbi:MAG: DUF4430 domain-containing protein [Eubacteriales bacterium]